MPKFVYIQVQGVEKPARIRADKIAKEGNRTDGLFKISNGSEQVGEFNQLSVQGWWIEDESDAKK